MWVCIYLDVTYNNLIESINEINMLYLNDISKLTYDVNNPLAYSFVKRESF